MIVPIFNAFIEANRVNLQSRRQISAAYLAQNELEEIKAMPRHQFRALDLDDSDGIDIEDDDWTETIMSTAVNGGTSFSVQTVIMNITNDLGISVDTTPIVSQDDERGFDSKILLSSDVANVTVFSNNDPASSYNNTSKELYVLFRSVNQNQSSISIVDSNLSSILAMPTKTIDTSDADFDNRIILNIRGYEGLSDEWDIRIVNQSSWTIDAKPYHDEDGHIKMVSDDRSLNNVYIGNAFPVAIGTPSTAKEYYRVVVTISYKGRVFEVLESTIGK